MWMGGAPVVAAMMIAAGPAMADATAQETPAADENLLTTYQNPTDVRIADPFIYQEDGVYYMVGTTDNATGPGFDIYTSRDMTQWTRAGKCYTPTRESWGTQNFWAPEILKHDGKYYLHYTAFSRREDMRNILVARADNPLGPYEDYAGPLFPGESVIDSHIYFDKESDEYYIYATPEKVTPSRIVGATIAPDFKALSSSATLCLDAGYGWEDLWIEGPIVHRHKDVYYMLYSGGAWWETEYSLGYATAPSPLGPWAKSSTNPVLAPTGQMHGPGHNGLAWSPDGNELFVYYHVHAGYWTTRRVAAMDRIVFQPQVDGPDLLAIPGGPSHTPQPRPGGAPPARRAVSDEFDGDALNADQWRVHANYPEMWTVRDGTLQVTPHPEDFWREKSDGQNVFLQNAPDGDFDIMTSVTMDARRAQEQAFITLWQDEDNYVMLGATMQEDLRFVVMREIGAKNDGAVQANSLGWPVCLKMSKRGNEVTFFASRDGIVWEEVVRPRDITGMTVRSVGLGAASPGSTRNLVAMFDWFRVERVGVE